MRLRVPGAGWLWPVAWAPPAPARVAGPGEPWCRRWPATGPPAETPARRRGNIAACRAGRALRAPIRWDGTTLPTGVGTYETPLGVGWESVDCRFHTTGCPLEKGAIRHQRGRTVAFPGGIPLVDGWQVEWGRWAACLQPHHETSPRPNQADSVKTGRGSSQPTTNTHELTPPKIQRRTKVLPVRLGLNSLWLLSLLKRESDWQPRRGCHM